MASGSGEGVAFRWQRELPHWLVLLAMFGLAALAWNDAPDRIPVHWGLSGEPDRFSNKAEGLLALPMIALGIYVGMLLVPRMVKATEEQLGSLYGWLRFAIVVMLAGLFLAIVLALRGVPIEIGRVGPALVGVLLVVVGSVMGRMRPNAIMGIRTPWTLTSQKAWDASHRVGGWLFIAVGAMLVLGGLTGLAGLFVGAIAGLIVGMVAVVVYGWRICRSDPRRLRRGQTLLTSTSTPQASPSGVGITGTSDSRTGAPGASGLRAGTPGTRTSGARAPKSRRRRR
jgi:uncharacterized membrane protein